MSVSFDPLLVLQLLGVFAGILNMLLSKAPRKILNCFLVFGGLKNNTLTSHFYFHSSKKYGLTFFLFANSLFRPSIHKWDWLSFAHPYGSISNSSCTGYQILCLLVPGSKSSADLWTSVQKKKIQVFEGKTLHCEESSHQLLSPMKRPGFLMPCLNFSCSLRERMIY